MDYDIHNPSVCDPHLFNGKIHMKIVQCDSKGQIIIPKKIRDELKIKKDSAFWISVSKGNIVMKRIEDG